MLEQYRQALRARRFVAMLSFVAMVVLLVVVHRSRQQVSYITYAFELGNSNKISPAELATHIRAMIDARAVFAATTGRRDRGRVEVRVLTPRSGRIIVLSAEDDGSGQGRKAIELIASETSKWLDDANEATLSELAVDIKRAESERNQFMSEISALTDLRQQALSRIKQLEEQAQRLSGSNRKAGSDGLALATNLQVAQLNSDALAYKVEYLTRIEERLSTARVALDTATAKLAAAVAKRDTFRPARRLFGPDTEAGRGFGIMSWAILLSGSLFLCFVLVPLLTSRTTSQGNKNT